jgi:uncharacterized protein YbjT (DUF2867 family)
MYLITGATGNVGSEVVEGLLAKGKQVRVFTRDAAKVERWGDRVEVVIGDFSETESFAKAVDGVEAIFMMNGALDGGIFRQLMGIAKEHGSPRIVFLSSIFAGDPESKIGYVHKDKEETVRATGLHGRFVRAGGFMTNAYQWFGSIKAEGAVYNALGAGKNAVVAPKDIAAVAVAALTTPELTEEVIEVTGGTLLTVPEQVDILSRVLGRPLKCVDVPTEAAVQGLLRNGVPASVAGAVGESFEAIRDGKAMKVTDAVERLTGSAPLSFEAWARKSAYRFA